MRPEKGYAVEEIGKMIDGSSALVLTAFTGLDTARMDLLRRTVCEKAGRYFVVKNSIFGIAARQRGLERLCGLLKGQVGVVFGEDDSLELLKAVISFGKENQELKILGGFFEGEVRSAAEMLAIAAMPPKEVAAGEFVGTLGAAFSEVVHLLNEVLQGLVLVVGSVGGRKEKTVSDEGTGTG